LIETEFGQKVISEIKIGDLIWTRKGLKKVYDVKMTGYKPVMTITTASGKKLTGTGEHKIWIDGLDWVELANLHTGDVVLTIENYRYEIHERDYIFKVSPLSSEKEVWNLSVEDAHEYFANGVLVKNCDELAAWDPNAQQMVWDMMNFGLRLGKNPRAVVTTTPKPTILIQNLVKQSRDPEAKTIITTGSTYENRTNLAAPFMRQITQYEGTNLGRQEIYAELIDIEESGILKRSWFKKWSANKAMPFFEYVIQSYDTAFTEKTENDPTGCLVLGIFRPDQDSPHCAMILDCWTEHLKYPELRKKATDDYKNTYGDQEAPVDILLIEDKGSGIPLIQDLQRAGLPVRKYNPGRPDKVMRLHAVSHLVYNGRVYIPESKQVPGEFVTWSEDFLREVCSFPNSAHDEFVDTLSQGLALLRDQGWISIDPNREPDEEEEEVWGEEHVNPYMS
jgi:predicted phage terminase large subunit-like protein